MGGQLSVDIENIVFCPASSTVANTEYSAESEGSSPSAKRRKYSSYAPARVPVSSSSNTPGVSAAISAPSDSITSFSTPATLNTRVTRSGYSAFQKRFNTLFIYFPALPWRRRNHSPY